MLINYYQTGQIKEEINHKNNLLEGKYIEYRENGE